MKLLKIGIAAAAVTTLAWSSALSTSAIAATPTSGSPAIAVSAGSAQALTASTALPTPSASMVTSFVASLTPAQLSQFKALPQVKKNEIVDFFADPTTSTASTAAVESKYPGSVVSSDTSTVSTAAAGQTWSSSKKIKPAMENYTIYNVVSTYKHSESILFVTNTATLTYHYQTGNNQVLTQQQCTWHDTGWSAVSINNISTNDWISSGDGHCYADVELAGVPDYWSSGYVDQDMDVDGPGIYHEYWSEHDPA